MQHLLKNLKSAFGIALLFAVGGLATMQLSFADDTATKDNEKTSDKKEKADAKKEDSKKTAGKKAAKKLTPEQEAARKAMQERFKKIQAMDVYKAPEGDLKAILEFIDDASDWQPKYTGPKVPTPAEQKDAEILKKFREESTKYNKEVVRPEMTKARKYLLTVIDKAAATPNLDEKDRVAIIKHKISVVTTLANLGDDDASKDLEKMMEDLTKDSNAEVARKGKMYFFSKKSQELFKDDSKVTSEEVAKEALALLKEAGDTLDQSMAAQIVNGGSYIEMRGDYALAKEIYETVTNAIQTEDVKKNLKLTDAQHKSLVESNTSNITRISLLGKPIELKHKLVSGEDFDISSYKGKVVLVDFWATWCGPCVKELPNVIENYKKYHDKGFEVVGISLDVISDQEKVEKFVKEKEVPWVQMQRDETQEPEDTISKQFGIRTIPATFLVDRNGIIVHIGLRDKRLGKVLEELFGPVEDKKDTKKQVSKN